MSEGTGVYRSAVPFNVYNRRLSNQRKYRTIELPMEPPPPVSVRGNVMTPPPTIVPARRRSTSTLTRDPSQYLTVDHLVLTVSLRSEVLHIVIQIEVVQSSRTILSLKRTMPCMHPGGGIRLQTQAKSSPSQHDAVYDHSRCTLAKPKKIPKCENDRFTYIYLQHSHGLHPLSRPVDGAQAQGGDT